MVERVSMASLSETLRKANESASGENALDFPMRLTERAWELHKSQQDDEALRCLDHALKLEPDLVPAQATLGDILLSHGDYQRGLPLYELRRDQRNANLNGMTRYSEYPPWNGMPTNNYLLIWSEQGFGDAIQMLRFIPKIVRHCPNVTLEVRPELLRLCQNNFGKLPGLKIVPVSFKKLSDLDEQCSIMSLPLVLGLTVDRLAHLNKPYLSATPHQRSSQRIGICYKSYKHIGRQPILEQIMVLGDEFDMVLLHSEDLRPKDWCDTAEFIAQLDLVITVDTAIAHLAGAMGKTTYLMLETDCDWRWMQRRFDSPWYPSMRFFRGDTWPQIIGDVAVALRERSTNASLH